jgi:hypothetical protein
MRWDTVSPILAEGLRKLMQAQELADFRLVGGTALSLHLGHRLSVDIDLFTDKPYASVDFTAIETLLKKQFGYIDRSTGPIGMGKSYFIGDDPDDSLKLDLYYTDSFIEPIYEEDGIRMATTGEIAAMKVDVVSRGARKKDFWDLHELLNHYSIDDMIALHEKRFPYNHDRLHILKQFTNFENADKDFNPVCLKGKHWELIRYEIAEALPIPS